MLKKYTLNLILLLVSSIVAVYLLNALVLLYGILVPPAPENDIRIRAGEAAKRGGVFDTRLPSQVIRDMRAEGRDVSPHFYPSFSLDQDIRINGRKVVPLSSAPDARTIIGNEGGTYPVYQSDGYGFHNPGGFPKPGRTDLVLLGDSYVFGYCVPWEQSLGGLFERAGFRCANLGQGGNGPLMELAALREYGLDLHAPTYLWFLYEGNDLKDALRESGSPILMQYLQDPNYSQGLKALERQLGPALAAATERSLGSTGRKTASQILMDLVLLRSLRGKLGIVVHEVAPPDPAEGAELLGRALELGRAAIAAQGGDLLVVIIPSYSTLVEGGSGSLRLTRQTVERLGLSFLDLTPVLEGAGDWHRFFPLGMNGHFNADGYALVVGQVESYLARAGREAK